MFPEKKINHFSCWSDYYGNNIIFEKHKEEAFTLNERLQSTSESIYLYKCYFYCISVSLNGAAVDFSKQGCSVLIEKSSFLNCRANYQGAVRVFSNNSILVFVCGQNCSASDNDGFSSIASDTINSFYDSSISYCQAMKDYIVSNGKGNSNIKSLNISHNKVLEISSALFCEPSKIDFKTSIGCNVSYCSIYNNTAKEYCIFLSNTYYPNCILQMINSNIIENNTSKAITSNGKTTIIHCCIQNNGNPCFNTFDSESSIILCDSNFDNLNLAGSLGTISHTGSTSEFTNDLTLIKSEDCYQYIELKYTKFYHEALHRFVIKHVYLISLVLSLNKNML